MSFGKGEIRLIFNERDALIFFSNRHDANVTVDMKR